MVCDAKAVLSKMFIAIKTYIKKTEITQINNLTLLLKELKNEEQIKPKVSRKKERKKFQSRNNYNIDQKKQF